MKTAKITKTDPEEALMLAIQEPDITLIPCPDFPKEHKAILYKYPHKYAGVWDCPYCETTDSCDHPDFDNIDLEDTYWTTSDNDRSYNRTIKVCTDCGVEVIL